MCYIKCTCTAVYVYIQCTLYLQKNVLTMEWQVSSFISLTFLGLLQLIKFLCCDVALFPVQSSNQGTFDQIIRFYWELWIIMTPQIKSINSKCLLVKSQITTVPLHGIPQLVTGSPYNVVWRFQMVSDLDTKYRSVSDNSEIMDWNLKANGWFRQTDWRMAPAGGKPRTTWARPGTADFPAKFPAILAIK